MPLVRGPSRWEVNRARGIRPGAVDQLEDQLSEAAERYVGAILGVPTVGVLDGQPDPGWDMEYRGWRIDVKHTQHENGNLAVPTHHPLRAHLYVLVTGRSEAAFEAKGWATRKEVSAAPLVDHGYRYRGKPTPYYRIPRDQLHEMHELVNVRERVT